MPAKNRPCDRAARARYNAKTYDQICVKVRKETAAEFKRLCAATGTPQAQVINKAIAEFIEKWSFVEKLLPGNYNFDVFPEQKQ